MSIQIPLTFLNEVARDLIAMVKESVRESDRGLAGKNQPYAACLFALPEGVPLDRISEQNRKLGMEFNKRGDLQNHNAHAETLLLNRPDIASELYLSCYTPSGKRDNYFLFTNTPSCPMCTTAMINAQIGYAFYFVEIEDGRLPLHPKDLAKLYAGKYPFVVEQVSCDTQLYDVLARQVGQR